MELAIGAVAGSLILYAAEKATEAHSRRELERQLRDQDAKLCRLLVPSSAAAEAGVAPPLAELWADTPSLAGHGNKPLSLFMVHCAQMDFEESFPSKRVLAAPFEVQVKLGAKGLSVVRESPTVWGTTAAAGVSDSDLGQAAPRNSFRPPAATAATGLTDQESPGALVAPFDWTCAFLLDHAPLKQTLRLRVRTASVKQRVSRARLRHGAPPAPDASATSELGRADLEIDLRGGALSSCRALIFDRMGRRIGAMRLGLEVRQMTFADLCARDGLKVGQIVAPAGLAEAADGKDIDQPFLKGVPITSLGQMA
jgi:hypothetical protein